jgi:hypothetical protein
LAQATDRDRPDQAPCVSTVDCIRGELCVRSTCHVVMVSASKRGGSATASKSGGVDDFDDDEGCGSLDASCCDGVWPDVASCVSLSVDGDAGYR